MIHRHTVLLICFMMVLSFSRYATAEFSNISGFAKTGTVQLEELRVVAEMDADEVYQLKESGAIMPLEELISQVHKDYPGRIIEIDLDDDDGRYVYELELVDEQGQAYELEIDARNGQVLKYEQDD